MDVVYKGTRTSGGSKRFTFSNFLTTMAFLYLDAFATNRRQVRLAGLQYDRKLMRQVELF